MERRGSLLYLQCFVSFICYLKHLFDEVKNDSLNICSDTQKLTVLLLVLYLSGEAAPVQGQRQQQALLTVYVLPHRVCTVVLTGIEGNMN